MKPITGAASRLHEKGISLMIINYIMAGSSLLVALLLIVTARQLYYDYMALREATGNYNELENGAFELQTTSDYLTEQVRNFTMTGKREYLNNYFQEAQVTQRREKALELLRVNNASQEAYSALEQAMNASLELMDTEYRAMRLTVEAYSYDISEFPKEVSDLELPPGLTRTVMIDMARNLVTDKAYYEKKDEIYSNMQNCLMHLHNEMNIRRNTAENNMSRRLTRLNVLVVIQICVIVLRIFLTKQLVIGPLKIGVRYIREGKPIPSRGAYELRFLADTYNQMYRETKAKTDQLSFEVNHDKLTGVYNRSGYDYLIENLDLSSCALLLVDVDKFKEINDTYGHSAGDRALVRVANAFMESFRSEDHICRIGGDEFAVIMERTGPGFRSQIKKKIETINKRLGSEEQPPISVSVGCAFGASYGGMIDKNADAALYYVKEHGRADCAFFE
ncbi:MAG: diguanylate cyclase [Oscillospiraceae bacterium]|nr:diguanylate cyclase [Oscillospiraceae bacterium]